MTRLCAPMLVILMFAVPAFAQSNSVAGVRGDRAVVARVIHFDALPRVATAPVGAAIPVEEGEEPIGEAAMEALKRRPAPDIRTLPRVTLDRGAGLPFSTESMAPVPGTNFEGITQGRYIPSEPTCAAGPLNIFSAGNTSVTVTDRDGSNRVEIPGSIFFGAPVAEENINDPVCWFDPHHGRFLALAFTHGPTWSNFYLAISQTSDARGAWYVYTFEYMYGGTWSDFEGLGVSADKIAITSQQYTQSSQYMYQRIRVFDRALAYSGAPVALIEFWNFPPPPGGDLSDVYITKAGRNLGASDSTIHLFTVRSNGGTNVSYRSITGPPAAPVLSAGNRVTVAPYTPPPEAVQKGTTTLVNTGGCRTPEFFVRDGVLTIAWHTGVQISGTNYSGIRLFRMRTGDRAVLADETYAGAGRYYYYPSAVADSVGTVFVGFGASSATEYPSVYATGKRRGDTQLQPSVLLHAGHNFTLQERWGDYTGIDLDAFATGPAGSSAWYAGQYAYGNSVFRTQINRLTYTYGRVTGTLLQDVDGDSATTADRSPLAGGSVVLKQGGVTVATAITGATGGWSFGWLESGVYDAESVPPPGGAATDAAPGLGANSQTRTGRGSLRFNLTDAQTASGNLFVVGPAGSVAVEDGLPRELSLDLRPNPTTGSATIRYALPREANVRLSVLDIQGREVARLENSARPAGEHSLVWNARSGGRTLAAGLYLVRLEVEGRTLTRRVVLSP